MYLWPFNIFVECSVDQVHEALRTFYSRSAHCSVAVRLCKHTKVHITVTSLTERLSLFLDKILVLLITADFSFHEIDWNLRGTKSEDYKV